ncbi:MAG: acyl--CoA ligase [Clostridia bacterium]|nr:acyl--CoA ligase [Clostridia bacterium]MBO7170858.1 acyl--CoA ligase [Clostridia bacterium]
MLTEFLEKNAALYPADTALVEINPGVTDKSGHVWREFSLTQSTGSSYRREMTWGDFDARANRFANLLLSRGVKKGTKVAILLMNCIEWLPIYFGILKAGALAVPMNYRYAADEIKYCLEKADAEILVFGPEFIGRVEQIVGRTPMVHTFLYVGNDCPSFAENYEKVTEGLSEEKPAVDLTEADNAAIYFSSGTTGFPKAILHDHASLSHAAAVEQKHHGQTKDDVFLCIPPLYHTGAKMHWFGSLVVGSKAVLLKGTTPELIVKTASEEKCSIVWLLVPWAQDVLDAIDRGDIDLSKYELAQWRLMHIGAQPVPPSLVKRWKQVFPHHDYDTNYGLSESIGPGCVHLGVENVHKVGAIGKAGYGWETKIVDENHNTVLRGEVGELAVKGPGVMKCYYKDEKATAEVLADGWLFTGDMAEEDEDGFIWLVDRKKDVIITGGENLYPVQIENFLRKNDKIKDAAVIGIADARLGEIAAAVVEIKEGMEMTEEEFNEFCLELPRYKRPRKVIFADIPRNPTGKIEKPVLRKRYGAGDLIASQNEIKK